jgi:succinate dehydrogenase / fumarate reductase, flavoprotein subunit
MDSADRSRGEHISMPGEQYATQTEERLRSLLERPLNGDRIAKIRLDLGKIMNEKVQVFRVEDQLKQALEDVRALQQRYEHVGIEAKGKVFNTDLLFHIELGFMLDCAEMVCLSAIERKESRGAHYRVDYPKRDDENWLHHITVSYTPQGPQLGKLPVTLTRWELQERKY